MKKILMIVFILCWQSVYAQSDYEKFQKYLKKAELGDAEAQFYVGWWYEEGKVVSQNYDNAVKWYQKAANQGVAAAQHNLGNCYYNGNGVTQNYYKAVELYQKAANQGISYAQHNLGNCYYYGDGVTQNYYKAVELYQKAANQGYAKAQTKLGNCYYNGNGVTQNYNRAVEWFRKAADQGDANAQYNLGVCFENGEGIQRDLQTAIRWYKKAAAQNHPDAISALKELDNQCATINFLSSTTSSSTYYNLRAGIKSDSKITNVSVSVNDSRGISPVINDGYDFTLNKDLTLSYGKNTIAVTVTNASGTTTGYYYVYVSQEQNPSASIEKVWLEHDVTQNGQRGMNIHVKFHTQNMKGLTGLCVAYFYNSDKTKMPYKLTGYKTMNGNAASYKKFTPPYTNSVYEDFVIFMPIDALTLQPGKNTYYCRVSIRYNDKELVYSDYVSFSGTSGESEKRIALVIGNANYIYATELSNPINDATDIAAKLRGLGFTVLQYTNLTKEQFDNAITDFGRKASNYGVALFFYAGHGIQYKSNNYLIPVNAKIEYEGKIQYECINAGMVLSAVENVNKKIIILDACRDNPFSRGWNRSLEEYGLAQMNAPDATFIAYSTSPNTTAADGYGRRNSPFTEALLTALSEKGLSISNVFLRVNQNVRKATNNIQKPWTSNSFYEDFIFNK